MRTIYYYVALLAISMLLPGCKKDDIPGGDDPTGGGKGKNELLVIKTDIDASLTKSSNLKDTFITGDILGLYVTSGTIANPYNQTPSYLNVKTTLSNNEWKPENDVFLSSANATVYAVYPYQASASNGAQIPVDATRQIDYMYGTHQTGSGAVNNSNPVVKLNMRHACSLIQFMFKKNNYPGEGKLTKIEIRNQGESKILCSEGKLDITTGTITLDEAKTSSIVIQNGSNLIDGITTSYPENDQDRNCIKGFVLPTAKETAQVGELSFIFTIDGKEYAWNQVPAGTKWLGGKKNTYYVTLNGTELSVENVIIEAWTPDGQGNVVIE